MQLGDRERASAIIGHPIPGAPFVPVTLDGCAGVFSPVQGHAGTWEVHCAAETHMRGRSAMDAFREILAWWWSAHDATRLITTVKENHAQARCTAIHLGFSRLGKYSLLWPDGERYQTVIYEQRRK